MHKPRITAAICTYDRYDTLAKAIASVAEQRLPAEDFEILVIDNSPDQARSGAMSKGYHHIPNLRWMSEKTPGLSNARNVALRLAEAPLIAFIDDDAIAAPDWLEILIATFDDFGDAARVVGGRVDPLWHAPRPAWLPDSLLGYVSVVNWGGTVRFADTGEWAAGTNISFRVDALKAVGGFSVDLGRKGNGHLLLSNDESDVIEKMSASGARLVYAPRAVVEHLVHSERLTQSWFRRRVVWQAVSDYVMDSARAFENAPGYWRSVTQYFAHLPPKYRTPRGLYVHQDSAELFAGQMQALYNFTIAMLTGFNGLEGSEAP